MDKFDKFIKNEKPKLLSAEEQKALTDKAEARLKNASDYPEKTDKYLWNIFAPEIENASDGEIFSPSKDATSRLEILDNLINNLESQLERGGAPGKLMQIESDLRRAKTEREEERKREADLNTKKEQLQKKEEKETDPRNLKKELNKHLEENLGKKLLLEEKEGEEYALLEKTIAELEGQIKNVRASEDTIQKLEKNKELIQKLSTIKRPIQVTRTGQRLQEEKISLEAKEKEETETKLQKLNQDLEVSRLEKQALDSRKTNETAKKEAEQKKLEILREIKKTEAEIKKTNKIKIAELMKSELEEKTRELETLNSLMNSDAGKDILDDLKADIVKIEQEKENLAKEGEKLREDVVKGLQEKIDAKKKEMSEKDAEIAYETARNEKLSNLKELEKDITLKKNEYETPLDLEYIQGEIKKEEAVLDIPIMELRNAIRIAELAQNDDKVKELAEKIYALEDEKTTIKENVTGKETTEKAELLQEITALEQERDTIQKELNTKLKGSYVENKTEKDRVALATAEGRASFFATGAINMAEFERQRIQKEKEDLEKLNQQGGGGGFPPPEDEEKLKEQEKKQEIQDWSEEQEILYKQMKDLENFNHEQWLQNYKLSEEEEKANKFLNKVGANLFKRKEAKIEKNKREIKKKFRQEVRPNVPKEILAIIKDETKPLLANFLMLKVPEMLKKYPHRWMAKGILDLLKNEDFGVKSIIPRSEEAERYFGGFQQSGIINDLQGSITKEIDKELVELGKNPMFHEPEYINKTEAEIVKETTDALEWLKEKKPAVYKKLTSLDVLEKNDDIPVGYSLKDIAKAYYKAISKDVDDKFAEEVRKAIEKGLE
jgi:hypothetical protein